MEEPTAKQLIKRLFLIIALGVAAAIGISAFFLYFFNPTESYPISELLLDPQVAKEMRYQDNGNRYVFDHLEFLYFNKKSSSWESKKATFAQYQKFYSLIEGDKSEAFPDDSVKDLFYRENPAILSIVVRKEGATVADRVFQELQLSTDGDLYRVKLREEQVRPQWAYFTHPGIYQTALEIFGE